MKSPSLSFQAGARALCFAICFWLAACGGKHREASRAPWLATPMLALEQLPPKALYYNGPARPWLVEKRPALLSADDRGKSSAKGDVFAQAVQNPKLFRQLDRQQRFEAVLLVGDPTQYRPLLDHLLEAGDWKLAYLDHTSLVFRRDLPVPWTPERLQTLRDWMAGASPAEKAQALAATAGKLVAIRELPAARSVLEEAAAADPQAPEVWSAQGAYRMALGDWKGALQSSDRALALDPNLLPALGCKAQALYASKHFVEAFAVSSRLLEKLPDDPGILFYHAKIAHEARQAGEEIRALRRLIELAERNQRPVSGYRVYLGQAYAASGDADPALAEFEKALSDPELPGEQRKYAQECFDRIRERTGRR